MPIHLITGLPGAGKSLGAVEMLLKFRESEPERPVYVLGIDGLRDGVALPLTPAGLTKWFELPTGSIVLVDECQKYMPARRAGDPPEWVRKLSEHRHFGLDFVLCTQTPGFLDSYVRGLVDRHTHLVRKFGTSMVDRYEWPAVCASPVSRGERKQARKSLWHYPKRCFDLYKSAELHTVKKRVPWQVWALVALPVLVLVLGGVAWREMRSAGGAAGGAVAGGAGAVGPGATGVVRARSEGQHARWASPADYVRDHLPRVANQPWSAPVFDSQQVMAKPDLYCISYEAVNAQGGVDQRCGCYTEQLTPYELHDLEACRRYARDGVYNPRRAPLGSGSQSATPVAAASDHQGGGSSLVSGVKWSGPSRAVPQRYTPPEQTSVTVQPTATWGG